MMRKRTGHYAAAALLVLSLAGCGGLRYSQVDPNPSIFHPRRIGVLPVDVGTYEEVAAM